VWHAVRPHSQACKLAAAAAARGGGLRVAAADPVHAGRAGLGSQPLAMSLPHPNSPTGMGMPRALGCSWQPWMPHAPAQRRNSGSSYWRPPGALKGRLVGAALATLLLEGGRGGWSPAGRGRASSSWRMRCWQGALGCFTTILSQPCTLQRLPCSGATAAVLLWQAMQLHLRRSHLGRRRAGAAAG
jgi:hypothetical protein